MKHDACLWQDAGISMDIVLLPCCEKWDLQQADKQRMVLCLGFFFFQLRESGFNLSVNMEPSCMPSEKETPHNLSDL